MDMLEYLKLANAEKFLHLEIDDTHYLSDAAYISEPVDTPANQSYAPVIALNGIPRFRRSIQELFGGRSLASWGEVVLSSQHVNGVDLSAVNFRGKTICGYVSGPRHLVALADRLQIVKGIVGSKKINAEGGLSFDVLDDQGRFEVIELPPAQYDATTMGGGFPAANHGLSKPLTLGRCRNVPAVLIDTGTLTYQVSDPSAGSIQAISAVYDNGVVVSTSAIDLVNGTFTLTSNPAGIVTADVDGVKDGVTWLSTTTLIIDWLARTYGGLTAGEIDISSLPDGTVGVYLNSPVTLDAVITQFMRGCLGWWQFTRSGVLRASQLSAPVAGGQQFGEEVHFSDVVFTEESGLYWSVPLLYQRNWQQLEPALSVAANQATWLRSRGYESRSEDGAILTAYDYAATAPLLGTVFDAQADAEAVGALALAMFGVVRYRGQVTLPVTSPLLQLGDNVELIDCETKTGDYLVTGLTDQWDDEIPLVECEVWG